MATVSAEEYQSVFSEFQCLKEKFHALEQENQRLLGDLQQIFLDDILVYSRTLQEHARHVRFVLQTLRDKQFYAKISKCEFFKKSITYLGHLITERGVEIDPSRIEKIKL